MILESFLKDKTLYIETWGCQMNDYDSKRIAELLEHVLGYKLVGSPEEAALLLMNTCSIREKAFDKVFSCLGRWRALKAANPNIIIGVGGCVASQEGSAITKRAPYVDLIFGPQTVHRLPFLLAQAKKNGKPAMDISFLEIEKFDKLPEPKADGPTAFVAIQEGCSKYCTFCIVPYTRGEEINRPFDDVIYEVAQLAKQGVREVTLLGQNVNAYRGAQHNHQIADLGLLITYIAEIDGIDRIRFTTSHPNEFSSTLIEAYANVPQLADHLHLPVQSGSDRILNKMGRAHTVLEYKSKIRQLRAVRPTINISTDIIVGFPGETESDFEKTLSLVKEIGFDQSFSFIYSPRPGTPAANLPDDVPLDIKKHRLQILQDLLTQQAKTISDNMVGTLQTILVTNASLKDPSLLCGHTESNHLVRFKETNKDLIGQFVKIHITQALTNSLKGQRIN